MRCPHCRDDSLHEVDLPDYGVRLDVCEECAGVWHDGGELQRLIEVADDELHLLDVSLPSERLCPRCLRAMFVFNFPRTIINVEMCGHCRGLWLDSQETERIKAARQQGTAAAKLSESRSSAGSVLRFLLELSSYWP